MSKSVLIIDTPANCFECPCFMEMGWRCQCRIDIDEEVHDGRPDWCPLVEAEPVRHGHWEQAEVVHDRKDAKIQDWQQAKCSVCGAWQTTPFMYYLKLDNYCPNCGVKMDNGRSMTDE